MQHIIANYTMCSVVVLVHVVLWNKVAQSLLPGDRNLGCGPRVESRWCNPLRAALHCCKLVMAPFGQSLIGGYFTTFMTYICGVLMRVYLNVCRRVCLCVCWRVCLRLCWRVCLRMCWRECIYACVDESVFTRVCSRMQQERQWP